MPGTSGASKKPARTGLPLTNPRLPKNDSDVVYDTAAARTTRDNMRFVTPGTAFCSSNIVGVRRRAASSTSGPEL